jgi:hypothetical protein
MLIAGLIGLVAGGVLGLGVTLLMPYCTPCVAILVGLGVGFGASWRDKPSDGKAGAALGAKAGAIAGVGHLLGQLLGMVVNGILVGPEGAVETLAQLGLDTSMMDATMYWVSQVVVNGGCGITNIAVAAGLGAVGGLLWYQTTGKKQVQPAPGTEF